MSSAKADRLRAAALQQSRLRELAEAQRRTLRELRKAKDSRAELVAAVYRAAHDAALAYPPQPPIPAPKKGRPGDHWALLHLTDWQLGKKTHSYSSEIAEARVARAVERTLRITDIQRHGLPITSCALLLGGDMVEGTTIFPSQPWQVDGTLREQVFRVASLIERVVLSLLADFDHVEVWEEYGNHGRIGRKGEQPDSDNNDLMAYQIVRERMPLRKESARLTWHPSVNWYSRGAIGNYAFVLLHGDEIPSFGGNLPAFGIVRAGTAWSSGVLEDFADIYMGHWHAHQQLVLPNGNSIYVTGSPETGSEYVRRNVRANSTKPSQRLHFIDPERGVVVSEHRLRLEDI